MGQIGEFIIKTTVIRDIYRDNGFMHAKRRLANGHYYLHF